MTSRRDFLKGLVAAAVATQLPLLPEAQAEPLINEAAQRLLKIGLPPGYGAKSVSISDVGNGWHRLSVAFKANPVTKQLAESGYVYLDFAGMNDGRGLGVFSPESRWEHEHALKFPDDVWCHGIDLSGYDDLVFSMYLKHGMAEAAPDGSPRPGARVSQDGEAVSMWGMQLEGDRRPQYISTQVGRPNVESPRTNYLKHSNSVRKMRGKRV